MVPTFAGITVVTFLVINLAPGDPTSANPDFVASGQMSRESLESFRRAMGLDRPLPERYFLWVRRVVTFDFGTSSHDHRPVFDKIREALPNTLLLSTLALLCSYLLAIPLGVFSAVRKDTAADRAVTVGLFSLYSLPNFWVAIMLVMLFGGGRYLDVFPIQGLASEGADGLPFLSRMGDALWHLVLPVFCLTYASLASLSRYMRTGMLDVIRQDYIRTARAKGLPERVVIFKHALRNSLIPILTLLGLSLPQLIGGSVVVEQIFGIPGMGRLSFQAIANRDYNTLMAVTTFTALLTMVGILLSDVLYAFVDPRIHYSS
jgi:peptide/nickel transport system permease protein